MRLVPLSEWRGINLHHGGLGQGVCADEFVVGGMICDDDDTDFSRDAFRCPGKVAAVKAHGTEFAVATTGAHKMDAFGADTCVCGLTTLLESSGEGNGVSDC